VVLFIGAGGKRLLDSGTRTKKLIAIDKDVEALQELKTAAQGQQDSVEIIAARFEEVTLHGDVSISSFSCTNWTIPRKRCSTLSPWRPT
jgi:16S rRNA C1402 N4-methylase RsmH